MKNRAALWTVYVCITVYSMSFMAQVPVLPYLLQDLGSGSSASFGAVQTAFSLAQLFGGLISGSLLDRWGPQAMLIISLSSAVANYGFTASARSLNALYISRVFTVMQHALLAARTYVSAVAPPEVRVKYLSILSVFNSVGFAAGPALGGVLTKFGVRTAAWASTLASALSIVAVMIMVPSRTPQAPKHTPATVPDSLGPDDDEKPKKKNHSWLQPLQVLKYPAVRQLMMINLVYNLAYGLSQSVFALMLRTQYNLASEQNGMVLSYQGALGMFSQAFLVEPAKRYLGEGGAVYAGCVTMACSYLLMAATAGSVPGLLLAMFPCAAGSAMLSTVLTAQLTRAGPQQTVGSVLALDMSLFAAVRLFTPSAGTALLYFGGTGALGCAAAGLLACLLLIVQLGWVRCDGGLPPAVPKETIVKSYAQHSTSVSGPSCQAGPSSNALLPGVNGLAPAGAPVAGAGYYQFNSGQQEGASRGDSGGGAPIAPHGAWVRWSSQGVAAQRTMAPIRARIAP